MTGRESRSLRVSRWAEARSQSLSRERNRTTAIRVVVSPIRFRRDKADLTIADSNERLKKFSRHLPDAARENV